jgi:hypothetical protein
MSLRDDLQGVGNATGKYANIEKRWERIEYAGPGRRFINKSEQ